jgi:hypothetical protein
MSTLKNNIIRNFNAFLTIKKTIIKPDLLNKPPKTLLEINSIQINKNDLNKYKNVCGYDINNNDVPLIYPHMIMFPLHMDILSSKSFPFSLMGLVHLSNKIILYKNIKFDMKMKAKISFSDNYIKHDKGIVFSVISKLYCENSNQLLWESTSTMLSKSNNKSHNQEKQELNYNSLLKDDLLSLGISNPSSNNNEIIKDDMKINSNIGIEYARVSGDYNPIHISTLGALILGQKEKIVHGMFVKAKSISLLMPHIIDNETYCSLSPIGEAYIEFKTPLYYPTVASLSSINVNTNNHLNLKQNKYNHSKVFEVSDKDLPILRGVCSWI